MRKAGLGIAIFGIIWDMAFASWGAINFGQHLGRDALGVFLWYLYTILMLWFLYRSLRSFVFWRKYEQD